MKRTKKPTPKTEAIHDMTEDGLNCSVFRKKKEILSQPIITYRIKTL